MVEAEITFVDLENLFNLVEKLIKHLINYVIKNNENDLNYLDNYKKNKDSEDKKIISKLKSIVDQNFKRVSYKEVIKILEANNQNFVFNQIK